jgi:hypothetical protein
LTVTSVTLGEVHTGLLHHSSAVSSSFAAELVSVVSSEVAARSDRPISHVSSPAQLTGVDCHLPTGDGSRVRAVGTVASRALITGGHLLQAVTVGTVHPGESDRRLPWSYYLARPGQLRTVNRVRLDQVTEGFLSDPRRSEKLDLAAICRRTLDSIQHRPELDHVAALRAPRIRLRFAIPTAPGGAHDAQPPGAELTFAIRDDHTRTLLLTGVAAEVETQIAFCADLARHDWLLTTLLSILDRWRPDPVTRAATLEHLAPALDHLLHLWMPSAHTNDALADAWRALESSPGFSRQWQVSVDRIRDQVALGLLERLGAR